MRRGLGDISDNDADAFYFYHKKCCVECQDTAVPNSETVPALALDSKREEWRRYCVGRWGSVSTDTSVE
jgi:hypothetical protein